MHFFDEQFVRVHTGVTRDRWPQIRLTSAIPEQGVPGTNNDSTSNGSGIPLAVPNQKWSVSMVITITFLQ